MVKSVNVSISATGEITVDAEGFQGTTCEQATQQLLQAFAGEATRDEKKPEYYAANTQADTAKLRF